jgi:hypothetical protein
MQLKNTFRQLFQLPYAIIILAPFVLLAPVLFTGKALFWGLPSTQFIPWWQWAFETLLSGHWPLWNPFLGMGAPLIANYQAAIFYPPYWLYFLFYAVGGLAGLVWSQALVVALHLAWGGAGMALLMKRLGLGRLAQTISGLAFGLSGYIVARGWFASMNAAVAWLPWILLLSYDLVNSNGQSLGDRSIHGQLSRKQIEKVLLLGLVIGLQLLAGHAQLSWYTLLLTALWMSFWAWQNAYGCLEHWFQRLREVLSAWISLAFAGLLGVAISAVQLLPTAEYLLQSQRAAETDPSFAMTFSFWPWRFLGFLAPNMFGSPVMGDFWGYATYWEDAVYIGLLPFLLACGVLLGSIFRKRPSTDSKQVVVSAPNLHSLKLFLLLVIFVSFLFALGDNTPIFPWLYRHIPAFDMFSSPTRFSIWGIFALALLAGVGMEGWRRPSGRSLYWTRLSLAGAFAVSLGAGLGWFLLRSNAEFRLSFVSSIALLGFWSLGIGVLALMAPPADHPNPSAARIWSWAVILWVAADLIVAGWGLNPGIELDFYTQPPPNLAEVQAQIGEGRVYLAAADEYTIKYAQYFLFESFDPGLSWDNLRATFLPNLNVLDHLPMVNNYDPMLPGRYARWMDVLAEVDPNIPADLLDLMAVSVVESKAPEEIYGVKFTPRQGATRVRWVPCGRAAADAETAWEMVFRDQVDFRSEAILENVATSQIRDCVSSRTGAAAIVSEQPNRMVLQTEAQSPGWLLLSDVWYPGWRAYIDGAEADILRADYLFRAVAVPEGQHKVIFVYRPIWFYSGLVISGAAWFGLLIYGFWQKRHKKKIL